MSIVCRSTSYRYPKLVDKLSLNVAKTQSMLASTKAKRKDLDTSNQNLQVKSNGTEPEVVSKVKYLGGLLDNSLDWKDQVRAVSLKVSRGLCIPKHAKKFLPFILSLDKSLYQHCRAPLPILLFSLGLCCYN